MTGQFVWYELTSADPAAAKAFYAKLLGWALEETGGPFPYTLAKVDGMEVAGLMPPPPGAPTGWVGYVLVDDVDAAAAEAAGAGATVHFGPADIDGVGRFASLADPEGARFVLFRPERGEAAPRPSIERHGAPNWHELHARDPGTAFDFYAARFGWEKDAAFEVGPGAVYQLFRTGGANAVGGIAGLMPGERPHWLYYWSVDAIDAASARVAAGGGKVLHGPHEVPGGMHILICTDPNGDAFGLVGPRG